MRTSFQHPVFFIGRFLFFAILASLLLPITAGAAWRVVPIRLDFDQRAKSGVITLSNDGEMSITFTIEAAEWSQDEQGQDQYAATQDLIFFPKVLTIEPKTERVVRAGIRVPATTKEKTYRLFIKEAAEPKKAEGTTVAVAIRFGVPIFAKPVKEEIKGRLLRPVLVDGQLKLAVANTGNAHFRISALRLTGMSGAGEELLSQEVSGWYLLAGATREFSLPIDPTACPQLKTIGIQMNADRLSLTDKIDVDPAMCVAR